MILGAITYFFILSSFVVPSPSILDLKSYAIKGINKDRAKFGLPPVIIDDDNAAAQAHANELLKTQTVSHWTTDGMKPYMRYSLYGGHDNVVQNLAQEKYDLVNLSVWNNNNNENQQRQEGQLSNDPFNHIRLAMCKAGIVLCDNLINTCKAINNLEYSMMYQDAGCCQDGHRMNILDKHHNYVSIGIAYNKFYLVLVQNFEDKYTVWKRPISYDKTSNTVSMSGSITSNTMSLSDLVIRYEPLPSKQIYENNKNRKSYNEGQIVARVIPHMVATSINELQTYVDNTQLIQASKSILACSTSTADNKGVTKFEISFSIGELIKKYGHGVYTIDTWYKPMNNNPFQASSVSLHKLKRSSIMLIINNIQTIFSYEVYLGNSRRLIYQWI